MKTIKNYFGISLLSFILILLVLPSCREYIDYPVEDDPVSLVCTLNITGGCLDQWEKWNDGSDNLCLEPAGKYLRTLNYLTTLPVAIGGPGPLTTDSTTDSYSGKYAAVMTTQSFSPQGFPIIIPGIIGTDSLDIPAGNIRLGKRYTSKPVMLKGYYKFAPISNDSAMIMVLLSKYNTTSHSRDTIGFNQLIIKNQVSTYTAIDMPIIYHTTTVTPDTITFIAASSAGIKFHDVMHCEGQVGSRLWIDEIYFEMP